MFTFPSHRRKLPYSLPSCPSLLGGGNVPRRILMNPYPMVIPKCGSDALRFGVFRHIVHRGVEISILGCERFRRLRVQEFLGMRHDSCTQIY